MSRFDIRELLHRGALEQVAEGLATIQDDIDARPVRVENLHLASARVGGLIEYIKGRLKLLDGLIS